MDALVLKLMDVLVQKLPEFILVLISFIVGAFVGPFLRERGKNLATKQDIGSLTDVVEQIRSDYKKEEHRYQLMTAGLVKKRAEVIAKLYQMMIDVEEAYSRAVDEWDQSREPSKDELRKQAGVLLLTFLGE